ncbi:hypothetical protein DNK49_18870 [Azoarcus communis]|uniref:Uncharacterized protein n=1 Tax=Parazoarcus communis SWub3 = DSM 12120 TaxID=1121029 RepID=A0A323UPY1_9RHOO|nr:hypothetical protein [Parazoarcus communis SWub3 = DSM 12120]PZA15062.1 hypothetical protein DNK49_18870 [Azoarcus communis] [Parazoarcus communis SWub3 = DSM 12120]
MSGIIRMSLPSKPNLTPYESIKVLLSGVALAVAQASTQGSIKFTAPARCSGDLLMDLPAEN